MKFSICVIGKNEAESLPRLAKSLEEFVRRGGDVVFLDTGSTDGTANVARDAGFRCEEIGERFVIELSAPTAAGINACFVARGEERIAKGGEGIFDYASARNFAASLAANDYIAFFDCDEFLAKLDIEGVEHALEGAFAKVYHPYIFAHAANGQPSIKFNVNRIYDRQRVKYVGIIHEVPAGEGAETTLPEEVLLLDHIQKPEGRRQNYLLGLALDCYQNPNNDRNAHYFGRELLWRGRPRSAVRELRRHIKISLWDQERGQSMVYIGDALAGLGEKREAIKAYQEAFTMDGTRREPLIRLAEYYWGRNELQKAACYAAAALEIPPSGFYGDNLAHYRERPHEILYHALWWLGDKKRSREHWEKALAYDPGNAKFRADGQFYGGI